VAVTLGATQEGMVAGDAVNTAYGELLTLLDDCPPGRLAPVLKAERDLVRARLASHNGDQAAAESFVSAISSLGKLSTPYHLAHGLLDHTRYLTRPGDAEAADEAIGEAREIAHHLSCQLLLDRAAGLAPAQPRIQA
jgi:hypothetical protein